VLAHLGEVEKEGIGSKVQQVGASLANTDVSQDAQPALVPLLLRVLCPKCAYRP